MMETIREKNPCKHYHVDSDPISSHGFIIYPVCTKGHQVPLPCDKECKDYEDRGW